MPHPLPSSRLDAVIVGLTVTVSAPATPVALACTKQRAIATTPLSITCLAATTPSCATETNQLCTVPLATLTKPTVPPLPALEDEGSLVKTPQHH